MRASLITAVTAGAGGPPPEALRASLAGLPGPELEVVIVAPAPGDAGGWSRVFPRARVLGGCGGLAARKALGARGACGDVLVFSGPGHPPGPAAVARLIADVEATAGRAVVTPAAPGQDLDPHRVTHGARLDLERLELAPIGPDRMWRAGPSWLYESPALAGGCFAAARALYEDVGGHDPEVRDGGVAGLDLGLRCWLAGYPVLHDPAAAVGPPPPPGGDDPTPAEALLADRLRVARKTFSEPAWDDWVRRCQGRCTEGTWRAGWEAFRGRRATAERARADSLGRRVRDEYWYAARYGLAWPATTPEFRSSCAATRPAAPDVPLGPGAGVGRVDPRAAFLDHSRNPRNRRMLPDADAAGTAEGDAGATLTIYLRMGRGAGDGEPPRIDHATFRGWRCGAATAYASLLTGAVPGLTPDQARAIRPAELAARLDAGAGAAGAAALVVSALRGALDRWTPGSASGAP